MIKTPILKRHDSWIIDGFWSTKNDTWEFCQSVLNKMFDIPDTATSIQLVAYKTPNDDRVPVVFDYTVEFVRVSGIRDKQYVMSDTGRRIRRLAKGHRDWHIECYYWEE